MHPSHRGLVPTLAHCKAIIQELRIFTGIEYSKGDIVQQRNLNRYTELYEHNKSTTTTLQKASEQVSQGDKKHDTPKIWKKKKRPRKELPLPPLPKVVTDDAYAKLMERLGETFNFNKEVNENVKVGPLAKASTSRVHTPKGVEMHGIQTTMHVEVVAPNHLRFVDEPRPPDIEPVQCTDGVVDIQEVDDDSDEEVVEMVVKTIVLRH
ncbi:hypothetical protein SESBI_22908 [Sesbania bispinosa]|nr:hypothetical protein SESBI_22908 [Sesbania bispinosa]